MERHRGRHSAWTPGFPELSAHIEGRLLLGRYEFRAFSLEARGAPTLPAAEPVEVRVLANALVPIELR